MENYVRNEDLSVTITFTKEEFENRFCFCADCGELMFIDYAVRLNGEYYCDECLTTCNCCGTVIRKNDVYTPCDAEDYSYCKECFEEECFECADCHARFRYEENVREINGYYYCDECFDDHRPIIQSYHTQKDYGDIHFYGDESRKDAIFMGFELELDSDHRFNREEIAGELQNRFGDFFAYENDGSLSYGFEMISQPASLSYHMSMMPKYRDAFQYLIENDIKSHDIKSCGLHVHLSRRYFGEKEDSSIAKLLFIFERYRSELLKFSRRTEAQCADWCRSRKQSYNGEAGWIKKAVMESRCYSSYQQRYYSVNLMNSDTIEIRLWRGSINDQTFEATLKFTARLAELCKNTRAVELAKMTFDDLLGSDEVILSYWNRVKNRTVNREEF